MANENTSINATEQGQTPNSEALQGQTPNTSTNGQTPNGKTTIDSLPQDIQDMIRGLRSENKRYREQSDAETKARQQAEEARMLEQGKYKELAEQQTERLKQLEAEITKRDHEALRSKVASHHGLPPELAARLVGQTEDELNADAAALKKFVQAEQPPQPRVTVPGNAPGPRPTGVMSNEQQIAELKNRFQREGHYGF